MNDVNAATVQSALDARLSDPIILETPIVRGETAIDTITLRKPKGGELRGLSLQDLMKSDVTALITVLPRIALPVITTREAADLEPQDLAACAGAVISFFMTAAEKEQMQVMLKG